MSRPYDLLVLGLGNVLCGDDGLGPAAVAAIEREYHVPEGTLLLDGGTLGLSLLPLLEDARFVLLIDAIRDDAAPGSLVRIDGDEVGPAVRDRLSVHQVGVSDVMDALRLRDRLPERLTLLGLVPETVQLRLGLSPSVRETLPELVRAVVDETAALGLSFHRRALCDPAPRRSAADALGL